jgi:hypothetical protein
VIDAGFLELVRLGELSQKDPGVVASLPVVDSTIRSDTASGPGRSEGRAGRERVGL